MRGRGADELFPSCDIPGGSILTCVVFKGLPGNQGPPGEPGKPGDQVSVYPHVHEVDGLNP